MKTNFAKYTAVILFLLVQFTKTALAQSPGGVSSSLAWWYRGDVGFIPGATATWTDGSPNGLTLTQSPSAGQPTNTGYQNFNPILNFDGTAYMANAAGFWKNTTGNTGYNSFAVIKHNDNQGTYQALYSEAVTMNSSFGISPTGYNAFILDDGMNAISGHGTVFTAPGITNGVYDYTSNYSTNLYGGTPALVTSLYNSTTSFAGLYQNGLALPVTHEPATVYPSFNGTNGALGIGAGDAPGYAPYQGDLAELIYYSADNNDADRVKIQSYLALKWGITLEQGTSQHYVSSTGIIYWDSYPAYPYNIAGIGRDDNSGLYQKQSQSVNGGPQVVMALGTLATNNQANPNTFFIDNQFFVWADNQASLSTISTGNTTYPLRFTRIWKTQSTNGFAHNITVYYPVSAFGVAATSTVGLIYGSSEASLSDGTAAVIPQAGTTSINGTDYYAFTVSTAQVNGMQFFSFTGITSAPGGVSSSLAWWYRGDVGFTPGATATWSDGSPNGLTLSQSDAAKQPVNTSYQNFNPLVSFDGNTYMDNATGFWKNSTGNTAYNAFGVIKHADHGNYEVLYSESVNGNSVSGPSGENPNSLGFYINDVSFIENATPNFSVADAYLSGNIYDGIPSMFSGRYNATTSFGGLYYNGLSLPVTHFPDAATYPTFNGSNAPLSLGTVISVGPNAGSDAYQGDLAEIIYYNADNTDADRAKIQSYLALKWGLTLDQTTPQDYVASDGSVNWDATAYSTYSHNIAGIGRDDNAALYQKQSQSVNKGLQPIIGLGTIAATNAANGNTLGNDKTFLIWGSDNGSTSFSTPFTLGGLFNVRMGRTWAILQTGTTGPVTVAIPASQVANVNDLRMLVSGSSAFPSFPPTHAVPMILQTLGGVSYYTATFDFAAAQFFTFAGNVAAPGGVVAGLKIWHKADAGVTATSNLVTAWDNQVDGRQVTNTGGVQSPTFADGSTTDYNFNPYLKFTAGTNTLVDAGATPFTADGDITTFTYYRGDNNQVFAVDYSTVPGNPYDKLQWFSDALQNYPANLVFNQTGLPSPYKLNDLTHDGAADLASQRFNQNINEVTEPITDPLGPEGYLFGDDTWAGGDDESFIGDMAEHIAYDRVLTTTERQQVNSYLGIKYGETLGNTTTPVDYLASDGTTVSWTGSTTYQNNVAGIGRDDLSALNQKQSYSANPGNQLVISLGALAATNQTNSNTFNSDKTFLVWGDNGNTQSLNAGFTLFSYNGYSNNRRINRVWKITNTALSQSVQLQFPTAAVGTTTLPGETSCAQYVIIYSTDPTFATGVTAAALTTVGSNYQANNTFPAGDYYFTFAKINKGTFGTVYLPLANTTVAYTSPCLNPSGWKYYYYDVAKTQKAFAINWNGNTEPGTLNGVLTYSASPYTQTSGSYQCNIMGRLMEVLPAGGTYTTNGGVQVRIFFDNTELNSSLVPSPLSQRWFKYPGNAAATVAANNGQTITGASFLTPAASGTEDSRNYVEFDGIQSFSTFGFASNTGANPLPVKLESFSATANRCNAILNWVTSEEVNTDKFIIEQSADGIHFTMAASVAAKNSFTGGTYQVAVAQNAGRAYYRLKIVNTNSTFTYSQTVTITTSCAGADMISVYPNPLNGSGKLTVNFSTAYRGALTIVMVNTLGQNVQVKQMQVSASSNIITINTAGLTKGTYLVRFVSAGGSDLFRTQKFVK